MRVGLHDAEQEHIKGKTFPNYALMKIAAYHKSRGDTVEWWNPLYNAAYGKIYSSKVFDFTPENPYLPEWADRGGTGYRDIPLNACLPEEIDTMKPDFSIYPQCDFMVGFTTRGCPNHCPWCVVPQKEGDIKAYRQWKDLVRQDSGKLVLMDNNILSCDFGVSQLESLIGSGYSIDLNQGMDARLVDRPIARILARLKWIRNIRFSCDQIPQIEAIVNTCELLKEYGVKPYRIFIYLLVTKDVQNAAYRVEQLKKIGAITIYAQAERNERRGIIPNREQLEFAQRYVYGGKFRKENWNEYCEKRQLFFPQQEVKTNDSVVHGGQQI